MSLFELCCQTIVRNPAKSLSFLGDRKINQDISEKLIPKILANSIPTHVTSCISKNFFTQFLLSELRCEEKFFAFKAAPKIAFTVWRTQLKVLTLPEECHFETFGLFEGPAFENLEYLEIPKPRKINKQQLLSLVSLLTPQLKVLKITHCQAFDREVLEMIGKRCPNLEILSIAGNKYFETLKGERSDKPLYFNLTKLIELDLSETKITDESLAFLGTTCGKTLKVLNLSSASFDTFPTSFVVLEQVNFSCTGISDEGLRNLGAGSGKTLKILNLDTAYKFYVLPESLGCLEEISLQNTDINNEGLENLAKGSGASLKLLNIQGVLDFNTLPMGFRVLVDVNLGKTDIDNQGLANLGAESGETLIRLNLNEAYNVTLLPISFRVLEFAILNETHITNEGLENLAIGCGKTLKGLFLNNSLNFTTLPTTFQALAGLDLCHSRITNEGLENLAEGSGDTLVVIYLNHASCFTLLPSTLRALQKISLIGTKISPKGIENLGVGSGKTISSLPLPAHIKEIPSSFILLKKEPK